MTQAIWNETVIAESDDTSVIEGNHYFPADSVRWDLLKENDRQTVCHWKGTANYYDIVVDGESTRAAVWQYKNPSSAAKEIKGHVAFGRQVSVVQRRRDGEGSGLGFTGLLRRKLFTRQER